MSIKTIVAGIALENDDDPVLERALQLAQVHDARLVLVHVLESFISVGDDIGTWPSLTTLRQRLEEEALAHIRLLLAGQDYQAVDIIIDHGRAHECIEAVARARQADLLIIGPGNPQTLRERLFGSTADRLTRSDLTPVLVVRTQPQGPYRDVTVAMDFSPSAQQALDAAIVLTPRSIIEIVHVVDLPLSFEQALLKAGTSTAEIEAYRRSRREAARHKLKMVLTDKRLEWLTPRVRIVEGSPAEIVAGLSCANDRDLLVLGSHGRNIVTRALLGSVARRALHGARRDILVVAATN